MKYPQIYSGDMVVPIMKGYNMMCCHCSTVHTLDFYITCYGRNHRLKFRIKENKRATAAARRKR